MKISIKDNLGEESYSDNYELGSIDSIVEGFIQLLLQSGFDKETIKEGLEQGTKKL